MRSLTRLVIIAVLAAAFLHCPARADMGFSSPIEIYVRFDNLTDYPQYDFYLKYGLGNGNPYSSPHLMKLQNDATVRLEGAGKGLTEVYLVAVPRGQELQIPPGLEKERWIKEVPSGTIQSAPLQWDEDKFLSSHNGGTAFYRISLDKNQLAATWVGGNERPAQGFQWCFAVCGGIVLAGTAAVVGLVFLIVRLRRRSGPSRDRSSEASP